MFLIATTPVSRLAACPASVQHVSLSEQFQSCRLIYIGLCGRQFEWIRFVNQAAGQDPSETGSVRCILDIVVKRIS